MRTFAAVLVLIAASSPLACQDSQSQQLEPLTAHCFDLPFLSVAARTPTRDHTPAMTLLLTDPLARTAGEASPGKRIPDASYGEINQIPNHPQIHSRALAVEVCNAKEGIYEIRVEEKSTEKYVLDVSGESPAAGNTVSLLLHHVGRKNRSLRYRFIFRVENYVLVLRWLDSKGREIPDSQSIEINDW